jgi:hypothetical protein
MPYFETNEKDGRLHIRWKAVTCGVEDRKRNGPGAKTDEELFALADQHITALITETDGSRLTDNLDTFRELFRRGYKIGYEGEDAAERTLAHLEAQMEVEQ